LQDPLNEKLSEIGRSCAGSAAADLAKFLALREVFPEGLAENPAFLAEMTAAYDNFEALLD